MSEHTTEAALRAAQAEAAVLRNICEQIAGWEPYQHCHDCNVAHRMTNDALSATPLAAATVQVIKAAIAYIASESYTSDAFVVLETAVNDLLAAQENVT